jgi:hypothetical protein
MQNEVEFLIEQVLARKEEGDAGSDWPGREGTCLDITLLMARALEQTPPAQTREIDDHCACCEGCRTLLENYRTFYRDDLRQAVPVGYTGLAQSKENWPVLARGLRLWLPYLLEFVGLDPSHTEGMLAYLEQRIPIPQDQRLSHLLPGWLVDYARTATPMQQDIPRPAIDRPLVERIALRIVLGSSATHETPAQRRFREAACDRTFASLEELLGYAPEGETLDTEVLKYRSHLYRCGQQEFGEGVRLLEVG